MEGQIYNVLFLCTGNTARSILAEGILRKDGAGRFNAFSAGSQPKGVVNPYALKTLAAYGYPAEDFRSKNWDEFAEPGAPSYGFRLHRLRQRGGRSMSLMAGPAHDGALGHRGSGRSRRRGHRKAARLQRSVPLFAQPHLGLHVPAASKHRQIGALRPAEGNRPHGRLHCRRERDTMTETSASLASADRSKTAGLGFFERYLTLWVGLCIIAGIVLGHLRPSLFHAIGAATVAQVNLPVAALVWVMIIPMLLKIDPAALREVGTHWRGIATTVGVNWLVKPFSMALLGWLFIGYLFRPLLPADQIDSYIAGLILLGGRPLHGDGVRVVASGGGRAALYAEPGRAQRRDHGRGFRARRRPFAGVVLYHSPLGDAVSFGRSLHRHPGHHRSALAVPPLARRRTTGFGPHA